ncbi:MAG: T9SS type A sorting domain-containing protein [Ignavibacteria bacterium]|nr:T9SS type A sorting domain-containing protein [Ignavibacteria bacterium]
MKKIIILFLVFFISQAVFSQPKKVSNTSTSEVIYNAPSDPVIEQIVKNIKEARVNGDITNQRYWEDKLNEITKPQVLESNLNSFEVIKNNRQQSSVETLNLTTLATNDIQANAISRERVTGNIYAAVGLYGGVNRDTLKVYRSTNNGITFNLILTLAFLDLRISDNGLDIEAVSKGDSSYAFIAMNYTYAGSYSCEVIRVRQDGLMLTSSGPLGSPGSRKYINGRVTSDNAAYTTGTYVYLSVTLDSAVTGGKRLVQKLFRCQDPFSPFLSLTSGYQNPAFRGCYGYSPDAVAPDSAKLETDIAFVNTTANSDQLYTVTIVRGIPTYFDNGKTLYFTKSTTYGSSAPILFDNFNANDNYFKESPRFAATGYLNNSAMVVTRRLYGGGDWDPYYIYSSDISAANPVFTSGYVDASNDITLGVSAAALYRSNGTYLFAFNNRRSSSTSDIFTKQFRNGALGTVVQANPSGTQGTPLWGSPDASFRNVNNDSCLVIWGGPNGGGSYVTGGCSGPFIGICSNSSITDGYSLSQNYPNPFNPSTKISFTLPVKNFVTIKVYDVNGKEIAELINEEKQAGENSVEFYGANLSSGVFYYKLTAGDFSQVRKMILIK